MLSDAKIQQIAKLEAEIEARRSELDRLRMDDPFGAQAKEDAVVENRDEANELPGPSDSAMREDSFGEIIMLCEQPVDENSGRPKKIAIGREERPPPEGSPRRSASVNAPLGMVYTSPTPSCENEELSAVSTEVAPDPPSPRSPGGLFEHLLRPFGPPGSQSESRPPSPRQANGFLEHLLIPLSSPGSQAECSMSETELLTRELNERELTIQKLEETISSDTKLMRKMKGTIERLSVKLLAASRLEQLLQTLESRSSSLEDEVEELRAENTRLRIGSQMLEEEKRRMEEEMRTELELLHLETGHHKVF